MAQVKCIKDGAEIMRPVTHHQDNVDWPQLFTGERGSYDSATKVWTIESDIKRGVQY